MKKVFLRRCVWEFGHYSKASCSVLGSTDAGRPHGKHSEATRASVLWNLQKLGFPLTECVWLRNYLSAPARAQLDKADAFQRLCSQFGIHP